MSQPTESSELRKRLRARINAVIQCRKRWSTADAASKRAKEQMDAASTHVGELPIPTTDDVNIVRDFLTERESRRSHWAALANAYQTSLEVLQETRETWHEVTQALAAAVTEASACADLATDDVFIAARFLSSKAPASADAPAPLGASVAVPTIKLDPEQERLHDELKAAVLETACAIAKGYVVAGDYTTASGAVSNHYSCSVKEPVRPTEEEIQRFLRGVEEFAVNRMKAHHTMVDVLDQRVAQTSAITLAMAGLAAAQQALLAVLENAGDVLPTGHTMSHVRMLLAAAPKITETLSEEFRWGLDRTRKPLATARETRRMVEVRKLMRQAAIALANYNEAFAAQRAAEAVAKDSVSYADALTNTSWDDCLRWHEAKAAEEVVVDKHNLTRQTKLDLLVEQVTRYSRDVTDAKTSLRRYHISITPHESEPPPCDEMRALINAASWITTPNRDRDDSYREGDFPVY